MEQRLEFIRRDVRETIVRGNEAFKIMTRLHQQKL